MKIPEWLKKAWRVIRPIEKAAEPVIVAWAKKKIGKS